MGNSKVRNDIVDCITRYTKRREVELESNPMDNIEWAHRAVEAQVSIQTAEILLMLLHGVLQDNGL